MLVSSIASITAKGSEEKNICNDQLFADMDRIQWITWACTCVKSKGSLVKQAEECQTIVMKMTVMIEMML